MVCVCCFTLFLEVSLNSKQPFLSIRLNNSVTGLEVALQVSQLEQSSLTLIRSLKLLLDPIVITLLGPYISSPVLLWHCMATGWLNVGDQILVCDGVSLIDVTHDEAAQALKHAMDMELVRCSRKKYVLNQSS